MTQKQVEYAPRRGPRIGDSVAYIRQIDGKYHQHPGLVYEVVEGSLSPYPSIRIAAFIPNTMVPNYTSAVQHRDHWGVGGGDDFERYWCWPDESEVHARYATPVVTGRPTLPDLSQLGPAMPYGVDFGTAGSRGADFLRATSAALGMGAPEPTLAVVGQELDRVARLGGQDSQKELDLVADLNTRMLARLEANRHRGGWYTMNLVELCGRVESRVDDLSNGVMNYLWELEHGVGDRQGQREEDARVIEMFRDAAADTACYAAMVLEKIDLVVARRGERAEPEPSPNAGSTGVLGSTADLVIVDDLTNDPAYDEKDRAELRKWFTDLVPGPDDIRRETLTSTLQELDKAERTVVKLGTAQERCRMLVGQLADKRAPATDIIKVLDDLSSAEDQAEGVAREVRELQVKLTTLVPSLSSRSFTSLDNPRLTRRLVLLEASLADSNAMLRSLASVVDRGGVNTNWDPLGRQLSAVLQRQHELMYPEHYAEPPETGPADPHASPLADEAVGCEFLGVGEG